MRPSLLHAGVLSGLILSRQLQLLWVYEWSQQFPASCSLLVLSDLWLLQSFYPLSYDGLWALRRNGKDASFGDKNSTDVCSSYINKTEEWGVVRPLDTALQNEDFPTRKTANFLGPQLTFRPLSRHHGATDSVIWHWNLEELEQTHQSPDAEQFLFITSYLIKEHFSPALLTTLFIAFHLGGILGTDSSPTLHWSFEFILLSLALKKIIFATRLKRNLINKCKKDW